MPGTSSAPSPPLTALGARLRANLTDNWTVSAAIFDGDAAGPGPEDPQLRDNHGVNFRINDPPLVIGEVQYIWNGKKGDPGLDGKFKLGGWRHFGDFSDQRFTAQGVSIANPFSSGMPANLSGNFGIYSVFEQKIYRVGGDDDRGIGIFARVSSSPSDRNLIDSYADGGIEFIGLSDARPKDKFGIAAGYAHVSSRARAGYGLSAIDGRELAAAAFRDVGDGGLSIRSPRGLDPAAEFSVLRAPRRRRHQPDRTAGGKIAEGCGGAGLEDRAEVLTGSPPGRG